ncbi:MAG TPA: 1-deoxy-D-xylulose-5-phosphate reductoisomerase [Vicinamibacterales bacterium]|nr:1-deoxy-D-xylulose-5-phosphate reductoisomerase [Vicinamibacterales bacterium]
MTRVAILGSTGSIGRSALSVVEAHPDRLAIVALVAGRNAPLLAEQVRAHRPAVYGLAAPEAGAALDALLPAGSVPGERLAGDDALVAAATHPDVDVVLCASSGTAGLDAALAAIDAGKTLALANKEVLVMAGALMVEAARRRGVAILPVDSEHNAIHQCLHGRLPAEVRRLVLTASGGPFRGLDRDALERVTPDAALRHPTWRMGRKITIDSATLMNKGLEVVEARWLFDQDADAIDVVIHPQSVVHSMVELVDGSVIAQLGVTDMRLPIQYAFSYPDRWPAPVPRLDLATLGTLEFHAPDRERFPCLDLAYQALREGRAWPIVLNAANEVAVAAFLEGRLSFGGIPRLIRCTLERADRETHPPRSMADVRAADLWARAFASETLGTLPSS